MRPLCPLDMVVDDMAVCVVLNALLADVGRVTEDSKGDDGREEVCLITRSGRRRRRCISCPWALGVDGSRRWEREVKLMRVDGFVSH
jgi:hypothetical protein